MQTSDETPAERKRRLKREANARWRAANPEEARKRKARETSARWRASPENRLKANEASARYKEANQEKAREALAARRATKEGRAKANEASRKNRSSPKGKAYSREYCNTRYAEDLVFKLVKGHRNRVNAALKAASAGKCCGSLELLGCSIEHFMHHLEGLFEPGMTWENRSDWEIDHVRPLASFDLTDPAQQAQAFHFSNTAPVWWSANRTKGSLHDGVRHTYRRSANAITLEDVSTEGLAGSLSDQTR